MRQKRRAFGRFGLGRVANMLVTMLAFPMVVAGSGSARAQDTRTVTEPVIPVACTVLTAQQAIVNGQPASETNFDTTRIQAALNLAATGCATGSSVELAASGSNNAFLIAPLTIPANVTLVVDGGVTVFGSRNPADYQASKAGVETCGTVGTAGNGCNPLISSTGANSGLMGYGIVDGRGQADLLVNGNVTNYSWWDLAGTAQNNGGSQNNPILVQASGANLTLYKITVRNSPMFHIKWSGNATTNTGFTAWGVKVITPFTARNSDGIDPSGANITITNSSISDGDDMVAVSAASASKNITVQNSNTYSGHGISVGSYTQGGLTNMLVQNITMAGTAADGNGGGLRLKTSQDRGGLVQNVTYQNICSANVKSPIYISPYYNTNAGTSYPTFSNITYRNVHVTTEGTISLSGYANTGATVIDPTTITLDNVIVDTLKQTDFSPTPTYLTINVGPGPVSPLFLTQTGAGVTYTGGVTNPTQAPYPCSASSFQYLVGELYGSTSAATNLHSAAVTTNGSVTLNAMLQPAMSQVTYASISGGGSYTGTAAPTAAVQFLEGTNVVGTATLGSNGTLASITLTGLSAGTHTYTAYYAGDSTYTVPYSFGSVTVTVAAASATTTTASASPTTVLYGGSTTLSAQVTSAASGTPSGQVLFVDNGVTPLASVTLSGAAAQSSQVLNVGTHQVTAVYSGDSSFAGSTSAATTVTVTQAAPTVTLTSGSTPLAYGGSTTLTATVAGTASGSTPTGGVLFLDGTTQVASATLTGAGVASVTIMPGGGTHSYTARYVGDTNYAATVSAPSSLSVTTAATTTALNVTGGAVYGSTTTLTATVTSTLTSAATPTGQITFYDGATVVSSGTLSGGTVTASALLAQGAHSLTARYAGDTNYAGSTSGTSAVSVVSPITVSANPGTLSLAAGASGSVSLSVTPAGGFSGAVTLTCASPVSYVTCNVTPATQTLSGTAAATATLNVQVAAMLSQASSPDSRPAGSGRGLWFASLLPLSLLCTARRRRRLRSILGCVLLTALFAVVSGCASSPTLSNLPAAGSQAVTVTATSGIASSSTTISVVVTN